MIKPWKVSERTLVSLSDGVVKHPHRKRLTLKRTPS